MSPEHRPTFHDLQENAEAGKVKRAIAGYFLPHNYQRSLELHERLGTPKVKKTIMTTIGRATSPNSGSNYRLDGTKSKIEAKTQFALNKSVVNEVVHSVSGGIAVSIAIYSAIEGIWISSTINIPVLASQLVLIALQRYNRARLIRTIDRDLQRGRTFPSDYTNWLGIDARAINNFQSKINRDDK